MTPGIDLLPKCAAECHAYSIYTVDDLELITLLYSLMHVNVSQHLHVSRQATNILCHNIICSNVQSNSTTLLCNPTTIHSRTLPTIRKRYLATAASLRDGLRETSPAKIQLKAKAKAQKGRLTSTNDHARQDCFSSKPDQQQKTCNEQGSLCEKEHE